METIRWLAGCRIEIPCQMVHVNVRGGILAAGHMRTKTVEDPQTGERNAIGPSVVVAHTFAAVAASYVVVVEANTGCSRGGLEGCYEAVEEEGCQEYLPLEVVGFGRDRRDDSICEGHIGPSNHWVDPYVDPDRSGLEISHDDTIRCDHGG
jgi:hypothetical protein